MKAQRWTITLDGQATSGDFLLVEVLNMPSIGPNLVLSDEANPSDGFFSVVVATESHRDVLDEYLVHRIEGGERPLSLTPRHAKQIEIRGWHDVHVDDRPPLPTPQKRYRSPSNRPHSSSSPGPCLAPWCGGVRVAIDSQGALLVADDVGNTTIWGFERPGARRQL